ncbi:MAG TPA: exodeoxyribonuclease III [Mycobacteriales bacterium]|nr:exodeoxyribonuclease III [Mycobacteriales bacterium]
MLLATWNVNSLTARLPRVLEFLELHHPDVLCLQETKVKPEAFPHETLRAAGYAAVDHSGGRWAGVAVLAPVDSPLAERTAGLPGEVAAEEARWVEAKVGDLHVVSVYVVNGRTLDSPSYDDKLVFLDAMAARLEELKGRPLYVAGDFNVAPQDVDVWNPRLFVGTTHTSEPERERLTRIVDTGLVDAFRHLEPAGPGYTYWDYRAGMFHKNEGMRIDLALVSPELAQRARRCGIDRNFRKGLKPSDHAPLLLELAD